MAIRTIRINSIDIASAVPFGPATEGQYQDGWGNIYEVDKIYRFANRVVGQSVVVDRPYSMNGSEPNLLVAYEQITLPSLQNRNIISMKAKFRPNQYGLYTRQTGVLSPWRMRLEDYCYWSSMFLQVPVNRVIPGATSGASQHDRAIASYQYPKTNIQIDQDLEFDLPNINSLIQMMQNGIKLRIFASFNDTNTGAAGSMNMNYNNQFAPYLELIYDDAAIPPYVEGIYPNEIVVNNDSSLTFRWSYTQAFNQPQSHFDLQYYNGTSWVWLANRRAGSAQSFTVPANTFPNDIPNGQTQWRVRSYIENGTTVSAWSEPLQFTVRSGSATPVITTVTRTPMFTIQWTATAQTGFQIQIYKNGDTQTLIHDSGEQASIGKTYTYKYLEDGQYTVMLRVVNSFGLWSAWASRDFDVFNSATGTIQLYSTKTFKNTIALTWETSTNYNRFFVLRNGLPIAVLNNTVRTYEDANSNGKNVYKIMGILDPNYTYSNSVTETICIPNAQISLFNSNDKIELKYRRGSRPAHNENIETTVTYQSYEGRTYPVAYKSSNQYKTHEFEFSFRKRKDYEKLLTFNNQNVVYKDCKGNRAVGNLEITGISHSISIDVQFIITVTDIGEYLNYAEY